jgi:hypothetical protein
MKAIASSSSVEQHAERIIALLETTRGVLSLTDIEWDVLTADLIYVMAWRCSCRFEGKQCNCLDRLTRERLTFISERAAVSFDMVITAMLAMENKAALRDWYNMPPFAPEVQAVVIEAARQRGSQRGPYRRR